MTETDAKTAGAVVLTEKIAARPEMIFDYLVEPDKILLWMGTEVDVNPEPGGKFWLNANGTDIASGLYVAVERPHRVVFTWGWEGSDAVPPGSSTVTITLTPDGDHTTVELRHDDLPGGQNDDHAEGWGYFLPRLVAVSEGRDPGADKHAGPND